jgi:hypothetical protein
MQGQPRALQGLQQGIMPPLFANNQVSTIENVAFCFALLKRSPPSLNPLSQGVPIPPFAVPPAALGVGRGMPMGMQQQAMNMQQVI